MALDSGHRRCNHCRLPAAVSWQHGLHAALRQLRRRQPLRLLHSCCRGGCCSRCWYSGKSSSMGGSSPMPCCACCTTTQLAGQVLSLQHGNKQAKHAPRRSRVGLEAREAKNGNLGGKKYDRARGRTSDLWISFNITEVQRSVH